MTNHLAHSGSPYLRQHANNPVDWYPWGNEALEKARRENKPIFLSIGYAACHWCHVMAHESFEDEDTAAFMNAHFVSIKVDREERPDLDNIYMSFVMASTGQGGWPMSVFLTPEGKPFYGGTYFPPTRRHNLPAFREVLEAVARLWNEDRNRLIESSEELTSRLQSSMASQGTSEALEPGVLGLVAQTIAQSYDWQNGGWGGAPKFPQPMLIEFLLRQARRGSQASLEMATHALDKMAQGGMYDVLGGGFARYSVEPTWLIPHFEKMLYDNAQLARIYLHAHQLTGKMAYREVCEATLDFVLREMTHPAGGFFSSLDADSEGEEGKYYLWSPDELRTAIANEGEADLFFQAYGVTENGNFEGKNILRRSLSDEALEQQLGVDPLQISTQLTAMRKKLLQVRSTRVRPATDDKVLVAWNALMLATLAEAGRVHNCAEYLQAAKHNADFLLDNMLIDGRLKRSWRDGVASHDAYLEDHAGLALGMLSLYQSDPNPRWYRAARELVELMLKHFADPAGGFYDTRDDHEPLLYRPKEVQDNATPSGNALAATVLLQLAAYEGRNDWRELAEKMLEGNLGMMKRYPSAFAQWWCAADFALHEVDEIAILGDPADPATLALLQPLWRGYFPGMVLAASSFPPPEGSPALLKDRPLLNQQPTAYVCRNFACQRPVNGAEELVGQISV